MNDTLQQTSALALLLEERLLAWEAARKPQELKMLECYRDVMRIPADDDTAGTGLAKAKKAKSLFVGSTRNKVRAARAKINDALFGAGKLPFDTSPTDEKLAPYADAIEDILTEQFGRMKFKAMLKAGVNTLATYGTGFVFGPFVREATIKETSADNSAGFSRLQETEYTFDAPYFELGNTMDVLPDPEAREVCDGLGVFWVTMESPHTVAAWAADKRYSNIATALLNQGSVEDSGSARTQQLRGNVEYWHKNDRIKVARFFGKVPASAMKDIDTEGAEAAPEDADKEEASPAMVDVVVIMAGGVVVKVDESPYGQAPTLRCVYEDVPHEIWGIGVAENNATPQKITNAAFRLFMEGKGMSLLGTASVDRSKFLPTEDFKKFPGKVYQMKPGLSPDERKSAILHQVEPDITGGWMDVIRMSEQFSDDDTGITKYTQGDDSSNLNKTASGISMIMSASSLPMKEVIQNIDELWIEPMVESLIEWNLKFLEVETVKKIHGEETAKVWQEIKEFGKHSFMDWQATGTSSFMQKEVLTNKLRAFADFAMSNPMTAPLIDARELLNQTWDVMEIGRESPILKEEGQEEIPPQVKQQLDQMKEQMEQMGEALGKAGEHVDKLEADHEAAAQANRIAEQGREVDRFKAETERLKLVIPYLDQSSLQELAASVGLQARATPDIAPGAPPEAAETTEQPADAGFLTPEAGQA
ncbi:MAG: hypothetical protein JWR74_3197 [Polaromonas sp.]|nr:hypothetical protein [Polaromonas sp.]